MRSIVSPCSATTAVKRWNMPPSSARVDFIALSSSSRCCRERGVQKCCCCCCCGGGVNALMSIATSPATGSPPPAARHAGPPLTALSSGDITWLCGRRRRAPSSRFERPARPPLKGACGVEGAAAVATPEMPASRDSLALRMASRCCSAAWNRSVPCEKFVCSHCSTASACGDSWRPDGLHVGSASMEAPTDASSCLRREVSSAISAPGSSKSDDFDESRASRSVRPSTSMRARPIREAMVPNRDLGTRGRGVGA